MPKRNFESDVLNVQIVIILLVLTSISGINMQCSKSNNQLLDKYKAFTFRKGLEEFIYGVRSRMTYDALTVFKFPLLFRKLRVKYSIQNRLVCLACATGMSVIMKAIRIGISKKIIENLLIILCYKMQVEDLWICKSVIEQHVDILFYIIKNKPSLTNALFCSIVFQNFGCEDRRKKYWSISLPKKLNTRCKVRKSSNSYKILQLTDLHYNPEYQSKSNAVCGTPLCCQRGTKPNNSMNAAGLWGDYRDCDLPWETLVNAMDHIKKQHNHFDFVYFVGDIIDHNVWLTSQKRNSETIRRVLNLMKATFPSTPVYPVLGNHEPHPVNIYSPNQTHIPRRTQWLFDLMQNEWSDWLSSDTKETILKGGYYTVLAKPGFRIVGLNSNVCYIYNWWLLYDDEDPFDQLKWLVSVLEQAELNQEKVHILSHIPSGDSYCLQNWGKEYSRIVVRFADTIGAQFNGHTHAIEASIYYDDDEPVNTAFNGGSLTPYTNLNPNYIIYSINKHTLNVDDYDLWIFDLDEANVLGGKPRWYKLFSFKDAYNVTSLDPYEMNRLVFKMSTSCSLQYQYFIFKSKNAYPSILKGCNQDCRLENLCNLVTSYFGEDDRCQLLQNHVNFC